MARQFFSNNLDLIFLFYGLAFFIMGISIISKRSSKTSAFKLAGIILLLAAFALVHGATEWLDLISIIKGYQSRAWKTATALILTTSFVFLFEFGRSLTAVSSRRPPPKWITVILTSTVIALIFISKQEPSIWPRYFLGFPGGILASSGFIVYYRDNVNVFKLLNIRRYFLTAAASIGVYGVIAGLITPKADFFPASAVNYSAFLETLGVPVQLLRAICAMLLTWAVYKILGIFDWENTVELKAALQEVTAAKAYVDNILKSIIDTLIVIDSNAKIRYVNKTGCLILGYREEELLGRPIMKLFEKQGFFKKAALRNFLQEGTLKNHELTCLTKNHDRIPMLFSGSVMRNRAGRIEGIVGLGKDIRGLKSLQERLVDAEKFAAMGKVAGIIGHEFRNQLGVMRNIIYLIKMKLKDNSSLGKKLNVLDKEVKEADRTIDNILTFARTKHPEFEKIDLRNLLRSNIEKIQMPREISITTQIDDNVPFVYADKIQLSRVFINIILNAVEAIKERGEIIIIVKNSGEYVTIQFKDSGQGIKEEDKNKIFEPFFSTKSKGTGLGLTTSKMIIEAHGGKISIKGKACDGTTVEIGLPVNQPKDDKNE